MCCVCDGLCDGVWFVFVCVACLCGCFVLLHGLLLCGLLLRVIYCVVLSGLF